MPVDKTKTKIWLECPLCNYRLTKEEREIAAHIDAKDTELDAMTKERDTFRLSAFSLLQELNELAPEGIGHVVLSDGRLCRVDYSEWDIVDEAGAREELKKKYPNVPDVMMTENFEIIEVKNDPDVN